MSRVVVFNRLVPWGLGAVMAFVVAHLIYNVGNLSIKSTVHAMAQQPKGNNNNDAEGRHTSPSFDPSILPFWAHTPDGKAPCASLGPMTSLVGLAPSVVWKLLQPHILNASYVPPQQDAASSNNINNKFQRWVNALYEFHTPERLQRSMAHPPSSTRAIRRLLQLVATATAVGEEFSSILPSSAEANASASTEEVSIPPPPIRILVLGGSVAQGIQCTSNSVNLSETYWSPHERCAWPWRLEHLLNHGLFGGRRMVEMINFGMGGTNSEIGSLVLEYQLLPKELQQHPPHIVIASYSPNDARDPDLQLTYRKHVQGLVRAAHQLRPCDNDWPLVILVDELFGGDKGIDLQDVALEQTGHLYKIASWYNVMAIVYSNVARHQATMFHVNDTYHPVNPLFGSSFNNRVHLGMGFHMGMAWTILFNFVSVIQDVCSELIRSPEEGEPHEWTLNDPPTKFRGRIGRSTDVKQEWVEAMEHAQEQCNQSPPLSNTGSNHSTAFTAYSTNVCVYAWMVHRQTSSVDHALSIYDPKHVTAALQPVLTASSGWHAKGNPIRQPRTGYYADEANATFALELTNIPMTTKFVTILSMKSYGIDFVGTQLNVSVVVVTTPRRGNDTVVVEESSASFLVDGYHETRTTVHFPHKFALPGGGANPGDSIRVQVQLVSGRHFKIAGIALCRH